MAFHLALVECSGLVGDQKVFRSTHPWWNHYVVSLSKTLYPLLSTGSSQEDPS